MDFLTKPFEQTEVLLRLRNLLQMRALHLQVERHNLELQADLRRRIDAEHLAAKERSEVMDRISQVLVNEAIDMVYQPIVDLESKKLKGFEALARFNSKPHRPPNEWFAEAATVGLGADLELLAIRRALQNIHLLPAAAYVSVNLDPATILDSRLPGLIEEIGSRVIVELTEHTAVDEYELLALAMEPLRRMGVRFAVDDAGSGFSSLKHILRLKPDIIKLDRDLTCDLELDPARRALASALVRFAGDIGSNVTAEGVETPGQLKVLHQLGVDAGQGYLLGRPAPISATSTAHVVTATEGLATRG
jgi:EAL domain-containing protein (putative c-di-GMP-specific phosphodiesterase class I)